MNTERERVQTLCWLACNLGILLIGFAVPMFFDLPWLGVSAACLGVLLIWGGYEIAEAPDDPEDRP